MWTVWTVWRKTERRIEGHLPQNKTRHVFYCYCVSSETLIKTSVRWGAHITQTSALILKKFPIWENFKSPPPKGPTLGSENFAQNVGPWVDFAVDQKCKNEPNCEISWQTIGVMTTFIQKKTKYCVKKVKPCVRYTPASK